MRDGCLSEGSTRKSVSSRSDEGQGRIHASSEAKEGPTLRSQPLAQALAPSWRGVRLGEDAGHARSRWVAGPCTGRRGGRILLWTCDFG
jgi:hypothetical protein